MRKYMLVFLAAALILGAGAGITYAYLSAQDGTINRFRAVTTDIKIEEEFEPPEEITPGKVIKKIPRIVNTSAVPCFVRVSVRFSDSSAEKLCEPLQIKAGWERKEDGWYYWDAALAAGKSTGPLFEQVRIREDAGEEIPSFDLLVYAEAVSCGNKSAEEAWRQMDATQQ